MPKQYRLRDASNREYLSSTPGMLGGNRRYRLYGRLDCAAALRALAKGSTILRTHRVFFADEPTAAAAGYRPCAVCMRPAYNAWKAARTASARGQTPQ